MSKKKKIILSVLISIGLLLLLLVGFVLRIYLSAKNNPLAAFNNAISNSASSGNATSEETLTVMVPAAGSAAQDEAIDDAQEEFFEEAEEVDENYSDEVDAVIDPKFMKNKVNLLLLGWDQSPERETKGNALYRDDENNFRSDVLILLVVDFETKKVEMISIPRDSYAKIYETKGKWKINAAFAKGGASEKDGFAYAMNTVSDLMGDIPIDYYVGVNMEGLKALVDAMGGIDYDVDVEIKLNSRVLEKGMQHLDGQKTLDYCRARKGIGTDIDRIDRQQRILFTIFEQMKKTGQIINIPKIYTAISDMIWTNLNLEQIASMSLFAVDLEMDNLHRHTLEGQYMSAYGAQFYVLNQTSKDKLVENIFGFKPKFDKEHDLSFVRAEMNSRAAAQARATQARATQARTAQAQAERAALLLAEENIETANGGENAPIDAIETKDENAPEVTENAENNTQVESPKTEEALNDESNELNEVE